MHISKFSWILVVIILSTILGISSVIAGLKVYYTIPSSGSISPIALDHEVDYKSEIRAVFLHMSSLRASNDWNSIAQTLQNHDINLMVIEGMTPTVAAYPSDVITSAGLDFIGQAVQALHSLGIEVYIAMDVLYQTPDAQWGCVDHLGNWIDWLNPLKQGARNYLKAIVEELVTKWPEIDGFMFDYIRWEMQGATPDMPYGSEAKIALEQWLGEPITTWPGDFAPDQPRYKEFLEWRIVPITQLVADMIGWMKAIKPDLKISAAPWRIVASEGPAHVVRLLGQDWMDWVMKGYLDWVAPMVYTYPAELETMFRPDTRSNIQVGVGGPEGKTPIVIFIANQYPVVKTPEQLKAEVDVLRQEGADGWIIWKYGGPGASEVGENIQPYLDAIDLFPVFSLMNINISTTPYICTITWNTDLPATSKVEYSTSPLFNASRKYDSANDFDYWDVDHVPGTIVENATPVTDHSITLTDLLSGTGYYCRVQSEDSNGIATSRVYTFTTGDVGSPP